MPSLAKHSPVASIEATDLYQQAVALGYSQTLGLMDAMVRAGVVNEQNWKLSPWATNPGEVLRIVVIGVGGGGNNTVNYPHHFPERCSI